MSIELILSSLDMESTGELTDIFMEYTPLQQSESVRFVVPSSICARHLSSRLLSRPYFPGLVGDPIRSWSDFLLELVQRSVHRIGVSERDRIISTLAAECRANCFSEIAQFPGFPKALQETLDLLRNGSISGDDLRKANGKSTSARLVDLAQLLDQYDREIANCSGCDDQQLADSCCDLLSRKEPLISSLECLILHGFRQLPPRQMQALHAVLCHMIETTRVVIHLQYDPSFPNAYRATEPLYRIVSGIPGAVVRTARGTVASDNPGHCAVLGLRTCKERLQADGSIVVTKCGDRVSEIELAVARILSLVQKGTKPSEIGVCSPGIDAYRHLQVSLRRSGISVLGESFPLLRSHLAESIWLALQIVTSGWNRELVESYLRSLGAKDEVQCLLNLIGSGKLLDRSTWLHCSPGDSSHDAGLQILETISALEDAISSASDGDLSRAVAQLASTLDVSSNEHECKIDSAAWKTVQSMLAEIPLDGSAVVDVDNLVSRMRSRRISIPTDDGEGVNLLSVDQVAGMRFSYVFVLGLVSEPRIERFGLLGQFETALLKRAFPESFLDHAARLERDRFSFYSAVSAASERTYLSYPVFGSSGQSFGPSRWITEIEDQLSQPYLCSSRKTPVSM